MNIKVYKDKYIGTLSVATTVSIVESASDELTSLVAGIQKDGIQARREILEKDQRTIIEVPITVLEKDFELSLIEWLQRKGFTVVWDTSDLDQEIILQVGLLSDQENKEKILKELPTMNYLEKTYILDILKIKTP